MATDPATLTSWYQDMMTKKNRAAPMPMPMPAADGGMLSSLAPQQQEARPVGGGMLSSMQPANPPAPPAAAATWAPGADSTVAGQFDKITRAGSPLIDQATTAAKESSNARGLLNSSLGVTAGLDAAYRAALPIAQQDATTFARAGEFNAGATNQAGLQRNDIASQERMQGAGFAQQSQLQTADIAAQQQRQVADIGSRYDLATLDVNSRAALQQADAANQQKLQAAQAILQTNLATQDQGVRQSMQQYDAAVKLAMQGTDNASRLQIATLDANTQAALAETNNKYRVQLQSSQSMTASYQSMVDGISRVMIDPNMDATAKQAAIGNLTALYNNALDMQSALTGLNLGQLLSDDVPVQAGAAPTTPAWNQPVGKVTPPLAATDPYANEPFVVGGA